MNDYGVEIMNVCGETYFYYLVSNADDIVFEFSVPNRKMKQFLKRHNIKSVNDVDISIMASEICYQENSMTTK